MSSSVTQTDHRSTPPLLLTYKVPADLRVPDYVLRQTTAARAVGALTSLV